MGEKWRESQRWCNAVGGPPLPHFRYVCTSTCAFLLVCRTGYAVHVRVPTRLLRFLQPRSVVAPLKNSVEFPSPRCDRSLRLEFRLDWVDDDARSDRSAVKRRAEGPNTCCRSLYISAPLYVHATRPQRRFLAVLQTRGHPRETRESTRLSNLSIYIYIYIYVYSIPVVTYAKGKMIEPVIFLVPLTRTILVFYLVPLSVHVSIYPSILHSRVHVVTFFGRKRKGREGKSFRRNRPLSLLSSNARRRQRRQRVKRRMRTDSSSLDGYT